MLKSYKLLILSTTLLFNHINTQAMSTEDTWALRLYGLDLQIDAHQAKLARKIYPHVLRAYTLQQHAGTFSSNLKKTRKWYKYDYEKVLKETLACSNARELRFYKSLEFKAIAYKHYQRINKAS